LRTSGALAQIEDERRDILNSARADARREIKEVRQELRRLRDGWALGRQLTQALGVSEEGRPSLRELERETQEALTKLETGIGVEETPPPPEPKYRGQS
jgi:hypothetical protein